MEFIRAVTKTAKEAVVASSSGKMEKATRETGKMAKRMVMEYGEP